MLLPPTPDAVRMEATTACQLKCPACPTAQGLIAESLGTQHLSVEHITAFMQANPGVKSIELSNYGEFFLNPNLPAIIKAASQHGVTLTACNGANFNTVSDEILECLVKYQFALITCSIDGASQETYSQYRRQGDFDRVIENIRKLNALKAQYQSHLPELRWQFVAFPHNLHDIPKAQALAAELNMTFFVKPDWSDAAPINTAQSDTLPWANEAVVQSTHLANTNAMWDPREICLQLWFQPQINADGRLLGCCVNYWGDFGDNVFEVGLKNALKSQPLRLAKQALMGRIAMPDSLPCARCGEYERLQMLGWRITPRFLWQRWWERQQTKWRQRVHQWVARLRL